MMVRNLVLLLCERLKLIHSKVHSARQEEFQLFHFVFLVLFEGTLSAKQRLVSFSSLCSGFLVLQ